MLKMLRKLRLRLTLVYLLASLGLVTVLGAGTYGLLAVYFQQSTDHALQYKMAIEFQALGISLPSELEGAEQAWSQKNNHPAATFTPSGGNGLASEEESEGSQNASTPGINQFYPGGDDNDRYDGLLAPVFVVPAAGSTVNAGAPIVKDPQSISQALKAGSDLRTIQLDDGSRLRLLTYRIGSGGVLQVGRLLTDQDRLLSQYLAGLLILGSASSLFLALASWVIAGRSIKPTQHAWEQQQQFISNASHELRTPLTILRANAEYALRNLSPVDREKSLQDIIEESDHMNRIVEDLLLLSRIDAKRLSLAADLVSLSDLLVETAHQVEVLASAKQVSLVLDPIMGAARCDRFRLRQVLLILLDNALRFTPAGGTIRMGSENRGSEVILHVVDNGSGIPAEHLEHIFERFYQVPGQRTETQGNGLGLSIAQGLVEAQHGKITITSTPGAGTSVKIVLPSMGE
jgi:signal transduction histidine kinase